MAYISAKEAADKWGISQRRVATLCAENRIENAEMVGSVWIIPSTTLKPVDGRKLRYNEIDDGLAKPLLKWAGGKSQLLNEIKRRYPFVDKPNTRKYAEPFVGGGAVLFDILNHYELDEIYISDINSELINLYQVTRDTADSLINQLQTLQDQYIPLDDMGRKEFFLTNRQRFNSLKQTSDNLVEKAALMVFLNRTCFNGLYRVNRKGEFNVPIGAYKNPLICDSKNIRRVSEKLQRVKIVCGDYKKSADFIDENTFVYFDPPYRPLNPTSNFTAYTENEFGDKEQLELAKFVRRMGDKGAAVMVSNSDPKNTNEHDNFFDNAYSEQKIERVNAKRMINSKASSRGQIKELLITNY